MLGVREEDIFEGTRSPEGALGRSDISKNDFQRWWIKGESLGPEKTKKERYAKCEFENHSCGKTGIVYEISWTKMHILGTLEAFKALNRKRS